MPVPDSALAGPARFLNPIVSTVSVPAWPTLVAFNGMPDSPVTVAPKVMCVLVQREMEKPGLGDKGD